MYYATFQNMLTCFFLIITINILYVYNFKHSLYVYLQFKCTTFITDVLYRVFQMQATLDIYEHFATLNATWRKGLIAINLEIGVNGAREKVGYIVTLASKKYKT